MLREIIYPSFVILLIASVWALGWEKSNTEAAERGFYPAIENRWAEVQADDAADPAGPVTSTFDPADE